MQNFSHQKIYKSPVAAFVVMKTVILCGGRGTRLRELTEQIPKPLVEVGGRPILWHIMKIYAHHGFNDFVLALGYKGGLIREYFERDSNGWNIEFADTGLDTNTGGRIKKVQDLIVDGQFMATYGDGVSNIPLNKLVSHHNSTGALATITCIKPRSQFGVVEVDDRGLVSAFAEKPLLPFWVNGGFFVFNRGVFDFIGENDTLEREVFERLASGRRIAAFKFDGFWNCMDTFKDVQSLNDLWNSGRAEWRVWK